MPVIDRSACHGKAGPQGLVVHFNSYFQTAGNFLGIGNRGLAVLAIRCYLSSAARPKHLQLYSSVIFAVFLSPSLPVGDLRLCGISLPPCEI